MELPLPFQALFCWTTSSVNTQMLTLTQSFTDLPSHVRPSIFCHHDPEPVITWTWTSVTAFWAEVCCWTCCGRVPAATGALVPAELARWKMITMESAQSGQRPCEKIAAAIIYPQGFQQPHLAGQTSDHIPSGSGSNSCIFQTGSSWWQSILIQSYVLNEKADSELSSWSSSS